MARQEHLAVLMKGIGAWNDWRKNHPGISPDLSKANLRGANLRKANLCRTNLHESDLTQANLSGANLVEADLSGSTLEKCNLSNTELFVTNLHEVDLSQSLLHEATVFGVDLSSSILQGAILWGVEFYETNLSDADLTDADLWLCHFVRCDLSNASIENAIVKDIQIRELKGLPIPPQKLRLDKEGTVVLKGKEAKNIFHQPALSEIYLSSLLSDIELACFHMHIANLHQNGVVQNINLTGQRREGSRTVLNFQSDTYLTFYKNFYHLMCPFPLSMAIDWDQSFEEIPEDQQSEEIIELSNLEYQLQSWLFADNLRRVFNDFHNIRIEMIKHIGYGTHLQLKCVFDSEKEELLSRYRFPDQTSQYFGIVPKGDQYEIQISE